MVQAFTHDDIIRYVYQETTETENVEIEEALFADADLLEYYLDCLDLKMGLNQIELQPSAKAIANIMAFSASKQAPAFY